MRRFLLVVGLVICALPVCAEESQWTALPLLGEGVLQSPDMPDPTGPPLKPVPAKAAPAPAPAPVAVKPVPPPPTIPAPRFDPNAPPALTLAYPGAGEALVEGLQPLVWNTSGPVTEVKLTYSGERCALGGKPRGVFSGIIGKFSNKGVAEWAVPWLDAPVVTIRLTGYDAEGRVRATDERKLQVHPNILQGKPKNCIVVSKSRQRLYYVQDGAIRRMHVVSTAARGYTTPKMQPGSRDPRRGAMGRVFSKSYAPVSRMYRVVMYYWLQITSSGSHGIHATTPGYYSRLGGPASHGCIRQHKADAKVLYELVPVGTPVYVL